MTTARVELDSGVATITLERPEVANAINSGLLREFNDHLDHLTRAASTCGALVITGRGRHFCSGADLKSVDLTNAESRQVFHLEMRGYLHPLIDRLSTLRMPVIAAVNGAAIGIGMSLALVADIIIAADNSFFEPAFARLGFVPDAGITYHLARRIGAGRSRAALMMADRIDVQTALDWGLVYEVVPPADVVLRAQAIGRALVGRPAGVLRAIRTLHDGTLTNSLQQQMQDERRAQKTALDSEHCAGVVRAFLGKRGPESA